MSVYDIEALCFDIEFRVLWYLCFFEGSILGCCCSYSVLDTDCGVHIALWINHQPWLMRSPGRTQPPQRRLHSAAQPPHRPQPPERARTSRVRQAEPGSRVTVAVAAIGKVPVAAYCEPQPWSERWEQPEFAWRRRLSYARYAQPSTELRSVWFHPPREWWTGSKCGMKIWTHIGRSFLGHLQTKTISMLTKKITFITNCVVIRRISRIIHPVFAVGSPQHRMIVCFLCYDRYDWFQQIPFGDFSRKEFTCSKVGVKIWIWMPGSPADQNNIEHQRRKIRFIKYQWKK